MKIVVFGLGYVGVVTAACFAKCGHIVVGVDLTTSKVDALNQGVSPIVEKDIEEIIKEEVKNGRLSATNCPADALHGVDVVIICVGTPSHEDGSLNTDYIENVSREIGLFIRENRKEISIVYRSTMLPGTMNNLVIPTLESASEKECSDPRMNVLYHPEFLREGSSVADFYDPPKIVIGENRQGGANTLLKLYPENVFQCERFVCTVESAEMVKYCDNLFHALKVTFANEIGMLCHKLEIDSSEIMNIFIKDRKLNISEKYLQPGFSFGGSCLPKDLRAILSSAREVNQLLPMLQGILESNKIQIERAINLILSTEHRKIGVYGLAFKSGTDDLRESPLVDVVKRLLGEGCDLSIYDRNVRRSRLIGGNKSYIDVKLPHLSRLLVSDISDLSKCDLIIIGHPCRSEVINKLSSQGAELFDLTGQNKNDNWPNRLRLV